MNVDRYLAPSDQAADASPALRTPAVPDAGSDGWDSTAGATTDRIALSLTAASRLANAKLGDRPMILAGLEQAHRAIAIGGRMLRLEDGIYALR